MSAGVSQANLSKQEASLKPVFIPTSQEVIVSRDHAHPHPSRLTHRKGRFKPSRVFKDAVDNSQNQVAEASGSQSPSRSSASPLHVTSVAFDDMGDRCVTAGEDDVFTLYDARKGK